MGKTTDMNISWIIQSSENSHKHARQAHTQARKRRKQICTNPPEHANLRNDSLNTYTAPQTDNTDVQPDTFHTTDRRRRRTDATDRHLKSCRNLPNFNSTPQTTKSQNKTPEKNEECVAAPNTTRKTINNENYDKTTLVDRPPA